MFVKTYISTYMVYPMTDLVELCEYSAMQEVAVSIPA
jgi:hypothetical protein